MTKTMNVPEHKLRQQACAALATPADADLNRPNGRQVTAPARCQSLSTGVVARHMESRAFLEAETRKQRPGPLVVVTHHAPHPAHLPMPARNPLGEPYILTAAYRSDLTALMSPAPDDGRGALRPADLWIYGHTHESFDAMIGGTRVLSNAKGYGPWMPRERTWDNPNFNPNYVIEI